MELESVTKTCTSTILETNYIPNTIALLYPYNTTLSNRITRLFINSQTPDHTLKDESCICIYICEVLRERSL